MKKNTRQIPGKCRESLLVDVPCFQCTIVIRVLRGGSTSGKIRHMVQVMRVTWIGDNTHWSMPANIRPWGSTADTPAHVSALSYYPTISFDGKSLESIFPVVAAIWQNCSYERPRKLFPRRSKILASPTTDDSCWSSLVNNSTPSTLRATYNVVMWR